MARTAQFALCVTTAVSAADVPQLRGRQLTSQAGNCDTNVVHQDPYTGYNHKNSGTPTSQREEDVGANDWGQCAEKCSKAGDCDGWTLAYNGGGGPSKCYLKVGVKPLSEWVTDCDVISGFPVPQLRGSELTSQAGDCDTNVVDHDSYTGYDHKNSGTPTSQQEVDIGSNDWWQCAEKCSKAGDCDGWTFAYNGGGGPYRCYLKVGVEPLSEWVKDCDVISGWSATTELSSESPGDPLCTALSPTDPGPCPDVTGRSGANISHDPNIQCVYNPECLKESLEGCFEETGCQYADVPQLRGSELTSQAGDCDTNVVYQDPYTGYNHKNSGTPTSQREEDVGANDWGQCAEKCSEAGDCDGWTLAYNGGGGPSTCYLKVGVKPLSDWVKDCDVISGFP